MNSPTGSERGVGVRVQSVVILGREFGAAMERLFVADLDQAEEVDAAAWSRRGTGRRLMEWLGRTWEYWL